MTMDLYKWGDVKFNYNFSECHLNIDNLNYNFILSKSSYYCEVMTVNDTTILTFKDWLSSRNGCNLSYFKREIFSKQILRKLYIYEDF